MGYLMTSKQFIEKVKDIQRHDTVYMLGTFGQPVSEALIQGKKNQLPNWYTQSRINLFRSYIGKRFAFDCVGMIKAVLWGWNGDMNASHGGCTYASNGVPDIDETSMIGMCSGVSTTFNGIEPGEVVWLQGHIGVYVGGNLVIECTPKWNNNVQYSGLGNLGGKSGYNTRSWTKHGKLPWVDYSDSTPDKTPEVEKPATTKEKLNVDGWFGTKTIRRAQQVFGTEQDGVVSNQWAMYHSTNPGLDSGWEWFNTPNGVGSDLIRAMQSWAGMPPELRDGEYGPTSCKYFQAKVGTTQDGYTSGPSDWVKVFQRWLNQQ